MPKVSVIIPVYKVERYLRAAVESVLSQDHDNVSIILVDDGSPDSCPAICDDLAHSNSHVAVIHKENGGLSSARNAGLDMLNQDTDYVLFLDSDDKLVPGAISGMVGYAKQNDAAMVIPDRYIKVYEPGGREEETFHFPSKMYTESPTEFAIEVMIGQCRAWRASALLYSHNAIRKKKTRFPVGRISEDVTFNLSILSNAEKIKIYPHSTLKCLKHDGSITSSFHKGFEDDLWFIDTSARDFLDTVGLNDENIRKKVDSMLSRNLIAYLFKIFSKQNNMTYAEKKELAEYIVNSERSRNVLRQIHPVPYFDKSLTRAAFGLINFLFYTNQDAFAYYIMSKR